MINHVPRLCENCRDFHTTLVLKHFFFFFFFAFYFPLVLFSLFLFLLVWEGFGLCPPSPFVLLYFYLYIFTTLHEEDHLYIFGMKSYKVFRPNGFQPIFLNIFGKELVMICGILSTRLSLWVLLILRLQKY